MGQRLWIISLIIAAVAATALRANAQNNYTYIYISSPGNGIIAEYGLDGSTVSVPPHLGAK